MWLALLQGFAMPALSHDCKPDSAAAAVLPSSSLTPPAGTDPMAHWRRSLARVEAVRKRRPDDLLVLRRWTLLRRRLLLPAVAVPERPTAAELYLAGLTDDQRAIEYWSHAAQLDPALPWPHLSLAKVLEAKDARREALRFRELCPGQVEGLAVLARFDWSRKESRRLAAEYRQAVSTGADSFLPHAVAIWRLELAGGRPETKRKIEEEIESLSGHGFIGATVAQDGYLLLGDPGRAKQAAEDLSDWADQRKRLPIEQYREERSRFDRIRTTGPTASAEMQQAYWRELLRASERWIERWPTREFAWRDRLQALAELKEVRPKLVERTADGALAAIAQPDGVRFGADDTRFRIARAYVRHGVRLEQVRRVLAEALAQRPGPSDRAKVVALKIELNLAIRQQDAAGLRRVLPRIRGRIAESGLASTERAGRERDYQLGAAWLEWFSGDAEGMLVHLARAFAARPVYRKRPGAAREALQPQNGELHEQGRILWHAAGGASEDWGDWVRAHPGVTIAPSRLSAPSHSKEMSLEAN